MPPRGRNRRGGGLAPAGNDPLVRSQQSQPTGAQFMQNVLRAAQLGGGGGATNNVNMEVQVRRAGNNTNNNEHAVAPQQAESSAPSSPTSSTESIAAPPALASMFDATGNRAADNLQQHPPNHSTIPIPGDGAVTPSAVLDFLGRQRIGRTLKRHERRIVRQFGIYPAMLLTLEEQQPQQEHHHQHHQQHDDETLTEHRTKPTTATTVSSSPHDERNDVPSATRTAVHAACLCTDAVAQLNQADAAARAAAELLAKVVG
jgi:hypothetical protein